MTAFQVTRPGEVGGATVTVRDLEESVAAYGAFLGMSCLRREAVEEELATYWRSPATAGRPSALLLPRSGAEVPLRLVELPEALEGFRPLSTFGWAALEINVEDADSLARKLADSPFRILGPPKELEFTDRIYPMQVVGPSGEVLYLNEVRGPLPDFDLPVARSFVDRIFIVVLAVPHLEEALAFYERVLGYGRGNEYEIPYSVINQAFSFPADRRHKLAMACVGRRVNVEVDQYPAETVERRAFRDLLPGGIASVALAVESLAQAPRGLLGPVHRWPEPPYHGRPSAVCRGTAGELVELVEVGP